LERIAVAGTSTFSASMLRIGAKAAKLLKSWTFLDL
jgi:hypothetical protein